MDQNYLMVEKEGTKFVLKIINSGDSKNVALLEVQTLAMSFLRQHGIPAQTVLPNQKGKLMSMEEIDCGQGAQTYCVRLMTYLHGNTIQQSPVTTQDLYHVGKLAATMGKTLLQMENPNPDVLQAKDSELWILSNVPLVEHYLSVMDGDPLQEVVKGVLELYKSHVQPKIGSFQKGIVHGDISDQNIIVTPADKGHYQVSDHVKDVDRRPTLTLKQATEMTVKLYGLTINKISSLPSYMDQNFLVVDKEGTKYVLKVMNSEESKNVALLEAQTFAMSFLHQHGIPAQTAMPTQMGKLMSMEEIDCGRGVRPYCVRLMTYLPGKTIAQSPVTMQDLYHIGKLVATLDKTLQQMEYPNPDVLQPKANELWILSNVPLVEHYLSVLDGEPLQEVVKGVLELYKSHVQPKTSSFQKGIIHGDTSDKNILVTPLGNGHHEISGVLDFDLLMNGCAVYDLAITTAYMMLESPSPLDVGGAVLAGWESVIGLNDDERDCLFPLVLGRLCQSLVYALYDATKHPENNEYLMIFPKKGSQLLTKLWELGKEEVEGKWFTDASSFSVNS